MVELSPDVGVCCSQSPQILRFLFYIILYHTENIGKGIFRDPWSLEGALERAAHWLQKEGN